MEEILNKLQTIIPKEQIYLNEPMSRHTTFKIGGNADLFIKVKEVEELKNVLDIEKKNNVIVTVIGNGSNILVRDRWNKRNYIKDRFKKYRYIR